MVAVVTEIEGQRIWERRIWEGRIWERRFGFRFSLGS
jgi:hypothetical protein